MMMFNFQLYQIYNIFVVFCFGCNVRVKSLRRVESGMFLFVEQVFISFTIISLCIGVGANWSPSCPHH